MASTTSRPATEKLVAGSGVFSSKDATNGIAPVTKNAANATVDDQTGEWRHSENF